jgi:hypothetical protein
MAKVVETKITYSCDRCGKESPNQEFNDGYKSGYAKVMINGSVGSKTYDGSWGGIDVKVAIDLCGDCLVELREFIDPKNVKKSASREKQCPK